MKCTRIILKLLLLIASVAAGHGKAPRVCLTFDDGPHPELTPRLLDILKESSARATFFPIGANVQKLSQIMTRIAEEGHEIGNHGWGHLKMTQLSLTAIRSEVVRTSKAIKEAAGVEPTLFRPPHGLVNQRLRDAVMREGGLATVTWNLTCGDWRRVTVDEIKRQILTQVRDGAVILMHDINPQTVQAMSEVVPELKRRGYIFMRVSELHKSELPRS